MQTPWPGGDGSTRAAVAVCRACEQLIGRRGGRLARRRRRRRPSPGCAPASTPPAEHARAGRRPRAGICAPRGALPRHHPPRRWGTIVIDPPRRSRLVLQYLLAHRPRAVPRDVLLDVFWPGSSPAAARNSLNVAMTLLRRALRPTYGDCPVVVFRDEAYRLDPVHGGAGQPRGDSSAWRPRAPPRGAPGARGPRWPSTARPGPLRGPAVRGGAATRTGSGHAAVGRGARSPRSPTWARASPRSATTRASRRTGRCSTRSRPRGRPPGLMVASRPRAALPGPAPVRRLHGVSCGACWTSSRPPRAGPSANASRAAQSVRRQVIAGVIAA